MSYKYFFMVFILPMVLFGVKDDTKKKSTGCLSVITSCWQAHQHDRLNDMACDAARRGDFTTVKECMKKHERHVTRNRIRAPGKKPKPEVNMARVEQLLEKRMFNKERAQHKFFNRDKIHLVAATFCLGLVVVSILNAYSQMLLYDVPYWSASTNAAIAAAPGAYSAAHQAYLWKTGAISKGEYNTARNDWLQFKSFQESLKPVEVNILGNSSFPIPQEVREPDSEDDDLDEEFDEEAQRGIPVSESSSGREFGAWSELCIQLPGRIIDPSKIKKD